MAPGNRDGEKGAVLTLEFGYSLGFVVLLTIVTVLFKDNLTPFYSFVFVFGTAGAFFLAVTFGSVCGMQTSIGLLTLMLWVNLARVERLSDYLLQFPFLVVFFVGLCLIPNVRPYILSKEIRRLQVETRKLESKVSELNDIIKKEHKENVAERTSKDRQLATRYSSRNTVLISFTRGLLQAGSTRELLNLLFYNLSKVFGAAQCAMLIKVPGEDEFVISRAIHPEHQKLENSRCSTDLPCFQQVLERRRLTAFPAPMAVTGELEAEVIFPVLQDDEVSALFTLAHLKDGPPAEDDRRFMETLARLTGKAIAQLQVVTSL